MGMAASQVRFLQLTDRKNDIGFQLTKLANQKVSLSRDMQKVSREYNNALNQKVLKWSNNQGVSYVDLSYQNLMKPSAMNQNKPYLLTDTSGKVVVDNQYKKFAEMISPDGKAGAIWDDETRAKIIGELCGFDADNIAMSQELQKSIWEHEFIIDDLKFAEPIKPMATGAMSKFLEVLGTPSDIDLAGSWADAYDKDATVSLGKKETASDTLKNILASLKSAVQPFFEEDDFEVIALDFDNYLCQYESYLDGDDQEQEKNNFKADSFPIGGSKNGYTLKIGVFIEQVLSHVPQTKTDKGNILYSWIDKSSVNSKTGNTKYSEWEAEHASWETQYNNAVTHYSELVAQKSELFTAEQESLIDFYDNIFSTIAEKGWVHNEQVNNTEYLNQMMQNNMYTMTVTDRSPVTIQSDEVCIDCGQELTVNIKTRKFENKYSTDIASNFSQIFFVNDSDLREQALVEYEYEKNIINQKESRIDTRMQDLQTEQSAINQMLQGLETVKKENIERTMNIFG